MAYKPKSRKIGPLKGNTNAVGGIGGGRKSVADHDEAIDVLLSVMYKALHYRDFYMLPECMIIVKLNTELKKHGYAIGGSTFVRWRQEWVKNRFDEFFTKRPKLVEFMEAFEEFMMAANQYLVRKIEKEGPGNWQKYTYILERRFANWQLDASKQATVVNLVQMNITVPKDIQLITDERQMLELFDEAET